MKSSSASFIASLNVFSVAMTANPIATADPTSSIGPGE